MRVGFKLKLALSAVALAPPTVVLAAYGDIADERFASAVALGFAAAAVIGLVSANAVKFWLFGFGLKRVEAYCTAVKTGRFDALPALPLEANDGDENEFLSVCRSLDWMAHRVRSREEELRDSIVELAAANERLRARDHALRDANCRLSVLSRTDPLTGLANRRWFFGRLDQAVRNGAESFAVLLFDIDHFKSVNDTYGHQSGDAALTDVSARIAAFVRKTDAVARVGGEEFALLIRGAADEDAFALAKSILGRVRERPCLLPSGASLRVTCSAGVYARRPFVPCDSSAAYRLADAALYEAKRGGRDRAVLASSAAELSSARPSA